MNRFFPRLVAVALILTLPAGVGASSVVMAQTRLTIATGSTSGVYYPLGAAVAQVIERYLPGTTAMAVSTGGSVDNLRMLADGRADIAFTQADAAWDAYKGYGKFPHSLSVRTIAVLYPERLQLLTRRESGVLKVSDLRGKRVSTGGPGSGVEIWANRLLVASGLDADQDIVRSSLGLADSAAALKERKLDAFLWAGGVPTKGIADLALDPSLRLRMVDTGSAVPNMLRKHGPVYTDGYLPANTYNGQNAAVKSAEVWTLLAVREHTDPDLVYAIVKALFEHKSELHAGHVQAHNVELSNQARGSSPIPFHPGAKKYLRERGVRILR